MGFGVSERLVVGRWYIAPVEPQRGRPGIGYAQGRRLGDRDGHHRPNVSAPCLRRGAVVLSFPGAPNRPKVGHMDVQINWGSLKTGV